MPDDPTRPVARFVRADEPLSRWHEAMNAAVVLATRDVITLVRDVDRIGGEDMHETLRAGAMVERGWTEDRFMRAFNSACAAGVLELVVAPDVLVRTTDTAGSESA